MKIGYLADHPDAIPMLARWSHEEWANLHPDRTIADVERLMIERSNKTKIPLCLVALESGNVIGMIALKSQDLESRPSLSPWLAGLYVKKEHRNRGVGKTLVSALEKTAISMGVSRLYLYTPGQEAFYLRLGWSVREHTQWNDQLVTVMEKELGL